LDSRVLQLAWLAMECDGIGHTKYDTSFYFY